jgi:hypothetical protein
VFVPAGNGYLYCFGAERGEVIWKTGAQTTYFVIVTPQGGSGKTLLQKLALRKMMAGEDGWFNPGDTDGDGLIDAFETEIGLDVNAVDSNQDGNPDETETTSDGKTLFEVATGLFPPVDDGAGAGLDTGTGTDTGAGAGVGAGTAGGPASPAGGGASGGGGCFIGMFK